MSPSSSRLEGVLVEVFREQRPRLWAFLRRGAGSAAEDLLQETFLRAWDHRSRLAGESRGEEREGARRFIWRVARNLVIDEIRAKQRSREAPRTVEAEKVPAPGHERPVMISDALRAIRETVETLPNARARDCIRLWLKGEDNRAIARAMSLGIDQVRGLLQRGKSELIRRASAKLSAPVAEPVAEEGGSR